jgi:hypothetical protein
MKKVTSILLLLFTINFCFAQFPETFDNEIPDSWATFIGENGEGVVQNWRHDANGYAISLFELVFEESEDWLVTPRVAITEANKILTFSFADFDNKDFGSKLEIRISTKSSQTNHADFETLLTVSEKTESDIPTDETEISFFGATLDLSTYVGENVYVAFVHVQQGGDTFIVDDVDFIELRDPPLAVINPSPANNAENVMFEREDIDDDGEEDEFIQFSWEVDDNGGVPSSFVFAIGLTPDDVEPIIGLPEDARSLIFPNLRNNTTFYWTVVPRNSGGTPVGGTPIWSFTSESDPLSIDGFDKQILTYFYNRSTQELNIATQNNPFQKVVIYDYSGRQVYQQSLKNTEEKINLTNLSAGSYIVKVFINNQFQTFKFIKGN